jgi:hypothetical protein
MTFSEISEVVPWLELASDQGQDLDAPQYGDAEMLPRFFKTHAWEPHCPKFSKVIVVLRNPFDVLKSFYKFFEGWVFEPGTVSMDAFAREFWLARDVPTSKMQNASYFIHLLSWYKRRGDPGVLILFFGKLLRRSLVFAGATSMFLFIKSCSYYYSSLMIQRICGKIWKRKSERLLVL